MERVGVEARGRFPDPGVEGGLACALSRMAAPEHPPLGPKCKHWYLNKGGSHPEESWADSWVKASPSCFLVFRDPFPPPPTWYNVGFQVRIRAAHATGTWQSLHLVGILARV